MRITAFLVPVLALAGCGQPATEVQSVLNQYALAAANQSDLTPYLSRAALESAQQSAALIAELGLTGYGSSSFWDTKAIGENLYQSCLDVSGTSFRNIYGELVELERVERQLVEVSYLDGKIATLELVGAAC